MMDLFINITFGVLTIAFVIIFCLFLYTDWKKNQPINSTAYLNYIQNAKQ